MQIKLYIQLYVYLYTFQMLRTELHVAHTETKFCWSCPQNSEDWAGPL